MHYATFLRGIHDRVQPDRYLEIGVRNGGSLALSRCRSVGIDPAYAIEAEIDCDVALFRTTSDEYFARPDPLAPTGGKPFDVAFLDGLHLFEYAFRDFINAEKYGTARSVILFDDVLPRSVAEAARERHTRKWTGDVYPIIEVLARYRPDLCVIPVGTQPTGLLLILGLDPASTVLADNYDEIVADFRHPDPQPVPPAVLDRLSVVAPERVLEAGFWPILAALPADATSAQVRTALAEPLTRSLGTAFGFRDPSVA